MRITALLLILMGMVLAGFPAQAESQNFGSFSVSAEAPGVIRLSGPLDAGSGLDFRRVLNAVDDPQLLVLDSDGGLVQMGLLVADDVHQRGMATLIPEDARCYSACAFIFFAGQPRQVEGELGVHQVSNDFGDLVSAQLSISDILDMLSRFGTPPEVLTVMFRTPPDDMHIFTRNEITEYGIETASPDDVPSSVSLSNDETDLAQANANEGMPASELGPVSAVDTPRSTEPATLDPRALSKLSAIEDYQNRPTRLALYAGLDFFGEDLASLRVFDAATCAQRCAEQNGACRAFTFNADDRLRTGPNCFLKESRGVVDGNSVAISGQFLSASEPRPQGFTKGVIDPNTALFRDIDVPGGDLSRSPVPGAVTLRECRFACIENARCSLFTFVEAKNECWLKDRLTEPRFRNGMTTGVKSVETFYPETVIDLE